MGTVKWVAGVGRPGRIVAARIERGEDAIQSIIALIKEYGFKSGTVAEARFLVSIS